jgi:hypothetical protein
MDEVEKMEVRINGRLVGNLSSLLFANYQTISTVSDYRFLVPKNEQISVLKTQKKLN